MGKLKVVITGVSGFVGKNLTQFIDKDLYEITAITRDKNKLLSILDNSIRIVEADLSDIESLKVAFENQDVLVNLAAEVRNQDLLAKTNIQGTENLIEAIKTTGIKKVIHLSSVGVVGKPYSAKAIDIYEDCDPTPQNEYERTKLISEQLFVSAADSKLFELIVLRPTNVFGENHPFNALLNLMQTIEKQNSLAFSKGAKVNYVYVTDVSFAILAAIEGKIKTGIYNVGYSMELKEFYSVIMNAMKSKTRVIKVPSFLIKFASLLGVNKLQSISNRSEYSDDSIRKSFTYPIGIEKGVQDTVDYYKQEGLLK